MTLAVAPKTRDEQFAFLRDAHDGPLIWRRLCLALAHDAPGIPALAPSAHAAAVATPTEHRVTRVRDLRRGMLVYWANFHDDNPADHVTTMVGWRTPEPTDNVEDTLHWTNDMVRTGGVDLVRGSAFPDHWRAPFWMGATVVNGFYLPGYEPKAPTPPPAHQPAHIGEQLDIAISAVRRSLRYHRAHEHPNRVAALARDLQELKQTRAKFPRP